MQDVHFHHFKSKLLRTTTKLRMNCRERTEIHFQPPLGQGHVYRISSNKRSGACLKFRPKVVAGGRLLEGGHLIEGDAHYFPVLIPFYLKLKNL